MESFLLGHQPSLLLLPEHRRRLCHLLTYRRDAASTHVTKLDTITIRYRNVCNDDRKAKWILCFCSAPSSSANPCSNRSKTQLCDDLAVVTRFQSFADLVPRAGSMNFIYLCVTSNNVTMYNGYTYSGSCINPGNLFRHPT